MGKNLAAVPSYLAGVTSTNSALADAMTVENKISRISLRGQRIRLVRGGEESEPRQSLDVVILDVTPSPGLFARTFYVATYTSGDNKAPDCSSINGMYPDAWSPKPQAESCSSCPQNVFGSAKGMGGQKAKACKSSKHVWVALADDPQGEVFLLNVTFMSQEGLTLLGRQLKATGAPVAAAVIRLSLGDADVPQIKFEHVGWLPEEAGMKAIARSESKDWVTAPALEAPKVVSQRLAAPTTQGSPNVTDVTPKNKGSAPVGNELEGW
jgi:hypothetical protein